MRLGASLLLLSVAGLPVSAFVRQQGGCSGERVCKPSLTKYRSSITSPLHAMSDAEIAALREQAAKAREEANRLAKVGVKICLVCGLFFESFFTLLIYC